MVEEGNHHDAQLFQSLEQPLPKKNKTLEPKERGCSRLKQKINCWNEHSKKWIGHSKLHPHIRRDLVTISETTKKINAQHTLFKFRMGVPKPRTCIPLFIH